MIIRLKSEIFDRFYQVCRWRLSGIRMRINLCMFSGKLFSIKSLSVETLMKKIEPDVLKRCESQHSARSKLVALIHMMVSLNDVFQPKRFWNCLINFSFRGARLSKKLIPKKKTKRKEFKSIDLHHFFTKFDQDCFFGFSNKIRNFQNSLKFHLRNNELF